MDDRQVVQWIWRSTIRSFWLVVIGASLVGRVLLIGGTGERGSVVLYVAGFVLFAFVVLGITLVIFGVRLATIGHDEARRRRSRPAERP